MSVDLPTGISPHPNLTGLATVKESARFGRVRDFVNYYASIHPSDRLPARAAFDPLAIHRLMPNLMLVEVEGATGRFRVKVVGDAVAAALSVPLHGRWLDEVRPEEGLNTTRLISSRAEVLKSGCAYRWYGRTPTRFSLDYASVEYVHCPLAADGITIDHIISVYQSGAVAEEK